MILTYKIKHNRDFSSELKLAKKVAEFGVKHKTLSSKDVKHIGLKSMVANQILRKYTKNKRIKRVRRVNLIIPNQGIQVDKKCRIIKIPCVKMDFSYLFPNNFDKINQIEINSKYVFISVTVPEKEIIEPKTWIGVDRNTTGHVAVCGNLETGKILKLGKKAEHIHKKYKNIRMILQKKGKYGKVKTIKNREQRVIKDLNHKISRKIIDTAKSVSGGIKLEKLEKIRKAKSKISFKYSLNSWSFYQLEQFIKYKAKLLGIPVVYVEPAYTSQNCSRCGHLGNRIDKKFKCSNCGHVDHADSNASFNIAKRQNIDRLYVDRDTYKGSTDTPKEALVRTSSTLEPTML